MNLTLKNLINAEKKAAMLFDMIESNKLLVAGKSEEEINKEIYTLAFEMFGIHEFLIK